MSATPRLLVATESGTIHAATAYNAAGRVILYCTGRSVGFVMPAGRGSPASCKACVKRAAANGVDLVELVR